MKRVRFLLFLLSAVAAASLCGCTTPDPDAESDIPWNAPQPWEGAPGIPGLESR